MKFIVQEMFQYLMKIWNIVTRTFRFGANNFIKGQEFRV